MTNHAPDDTGSVPYDDLLEFQVKVIEVHVGLPGKTLTAVKAWLFDQMSVMQSK